MLPADLLSAVITICLEVLWQETMGGKKKILGTNIWHLSIRPQVPFYSDHLYKHPGFTHNILFLFCCPVLDNFPESISKITCYKVTIWLRWAETLELNVSKQKKYGFIFCSVYINDISSAVVYKMFFGYNKMIYGYKWNPVFPEGTIYGTGTYQHNTVALLVCINPPENIDNVVITLFRMSASIKQRATNTVSVIHLGMTVETLDLIVKTYLRTKVWKEMTKRDWGESLKHIQRLSVKINKSSF